MGAERQINKTPRRTFGGLGRCGLFFSLPFLGVGIACLLSYAGYLFQLQGPQLLVLWFGVVFGGVGLMMFVTSLREVVRRAATRGALAQRELQRFLEDYPWNPWRIQDDSLRHIGREVLGLLFFIIFMAPFNYFVWHTKIGIPHIIVGIFDVALVAGAIATAVHIARTINHGTTFLKLARFPFFLGERCEARFYAPRGLGQFHSMEVLLRCVEERIVSERRGREASNRLACFQLYEDKLEIAPPET